MKMEMLDVKDRKILYQLDLNCRQSNRQIGNKVGLSKTTVACRIKRMEEKGIITGYWTAIDSYRLGYHVFRIYLNFVDVNENIKNKIIEYFINYKNVWAIIECTSPIDFDVVLWVNDVYEFNYFWNATLEKFGNFFSETFISILNQVASFKKSYLLPEKNKSDDREFYTINCRELSKRIDETDYQLLNEIVDNARMPLTILSEKMHCSPQAVTYKLKNLIKKDVIKAFRVGIDISKLGLSRTDLDIYFKDYTKRKKIFSYLKKNPFVEYAMELSIGWCDLQIEINIENFNHISNLIDSINAVSPGAIRKINYWIAKKVHKERWLPEMSEEDFKRK